MKQGSAMAKATKRTTPTKKRTPTGAKTAAPRKSAAAATRKSTRAKADSEKQKVTAHATSRVANKPASKRSRPSRQRPDDMTPDAVFVEVIEEQIPDVVFVTEVETVDLDADELVAGLAEEIDEAEILGSEKRRQ